MDVKRFNIQKILVSKTNIDHTLKVIDEALTSGNIGYICVTNARTTYFANHDMKYLNIQNNSLLTVPDGIPLVWIAHNRGYKCVGRVSGKDLMEAVFNISYQKKYSHYFYGSTPETIKLLSDNLTSKFPKIQIKKAISPPFQPVEDFDLQSLAVELNKLKPTFFWCGLGAPKQEQIIYKLQPLLDETICVGVGLAFEYIAKTVTRAPKWMQKNGLEGIFRLVQQPKYIKRAIIPLSWIFIQYIKSFKVFRKYPH